MSETDDVLLAVRGAAGIITLNRPDAMNALTLDMVRTMRRALDAWAVDERVRTVVLTAAGDRAFCAGGDIKRIYALERAGARAEALSFFGEEYRLNALIKRYPKPYLSLIDGIVMGGGVGLSVHGAYRIAGERFSFAMPEVGIGFFPDVGGTFALPRLPRHAGLYLALTGERIGRADALHLGLATHAVARERFEAIQEALEGGATPDVVLPRHSGAGVAAGPLAAELDLIETCFGASDVAGVLKALEDMANRGSAFAERTAAAIRTRSPTSVAITFEQMRRGIRLSFAEALTLEYRIVTRILDGHDYPEGVRAVLVDRDQRPRWKPNAIEAVSAAAIAVYFAPLDGPEPDFS